MEAQRPSGPPTSVNEQPVQLASCFQAISPAPNLSISPVILQHEQALSQTIYLKALTIPFYQPIQSECLQPSNKISSQTSITLDSSNIPLILNPFSHSKGTDNIQTGIQKQPGTIGIVNGLSVLPQNYSPCPSFGSPGKCKNAGKYLCKHCGRDCLKPSVLEKHVRSHTGERPFPCTTCGIAFKTQSNLYKHRRTQTHVNNTRLPPESESSSPIGENEKVTETIGSLQKIKVNDRNCDSTRAMITQASLVTTAEITSEKNPPDTSSSAINGLFFVSESQWMTMDNSCHGEVNQSVLEKEAMKDPATPLQKRKIQEQRYQTVSKHSQLQRQQATYSEKLWDSRSPDGKLKKCESTDSGYLSRSDSVEQQMLSPSPLHSLCEHSTESESDTAITSLRCTAGNMSKVDSAEKATGGLTLEKKKLEEHISKLISHNKAVMDDTQLDNVRPRKTILSKQGSIDLPMPYTYKDSFHFDIRPPELNRKKNLSRYTATSIFTPVEKAKPMLFHSVPTQFSTTIDCVPVTRSNSLPFIESAKRIQDQVDISKAPSFARMLPESSALLPSKKFSASMAAFPNSHPRALVRQAAVDDLPLSNTSVSSPSLEETKGSKKSGFEGTNTKNKKQSQRNAKKFTQEKWQVYGDETFKKIYQKMKNNQTTKKQKEKIIAISSFHSDSKDTISHDGIPRDGRSFQMGNLVTISAKLNTEELVSSPVTISAKLNTEELKGHYITSSLSQCASSQESLGSFAEFMGTSYSVSDCEQSELTKTSVESSCNELYVSKQDPTDSSKVLLLSTSCELSSQLQQTTEQETSSPLNIASLKDIGLKDACAQGELIKCVRVHEDISAAQGEDTTGKESFQLAQGGLQREYCKNSEPVHGPTKLTSKRKMLKVDKLKRKENMLKSSHGPSSSAERVVELLDCYKPIDTVASESINYSVKEEKQTSMVGGSNMVCEESVRWPVMTSNNQNYIANITDTTSVLSFEQSGIEIKNGHTNNMCALQKLKNEPYPVITWTETSLESGYMARALTPAQHLIFDQVNPHLKQNDFLPKYILNYSQGKTTGLPLVLAEPENMHCISTASSIPASSSSPLGCNPTDAFLYPPAILETTSITTRVSKKCHLQRVRQKEKMKDMWTEASNRDNLGAQKLAQESNVRTIVCTSHTSGKKICFTTMYTGGFFISSDITGKNSALQLIHSGNNSVISVSSLVEGTVFCGNVDEKIKEWQPDINSFSGLQGLPTCSMNRCLCHSSNMLYCHVLCTQQREVHKLPQLSSHSGNSKVPSMDVSFPTLNSEPQLTWCCLSKNLPLPVEQKEKRDSAYSSLHTCMNENLISKCNHFFYKMKNTRKAASAGLTSGMSQTAISPVSPGQQIEKYFSTAGIDGFFKNTPEQEKTKDKFNKMRELTAHKGKKTQKRKKVKISPKRYKGRYRHRYILLKANRPTKQHRPTSRTLEFSKNHSHISNSCQHCRKCICPSAASHGIDQNPQEASGSSGEMMNMKDIPVAAREHSNGSLSLEKDPTVPDAPIAKYSCPLANNAPAQKNRSQDIYSLRILQREPRPDDNSDYCWPSASNFECIEANKAHVHNISASRTTSPILIESNADCNNKKLKFQTVTMLEPSVHSTRRKQSTNEDFYPSLKEQSVFQNPYPVPHKSRMLIEKSVSGIALPGLRQGQESKSSSSPLRQDKNNCSVKPGDHCGKLCESSDSVGTPGILSKVYKKQSLEIQNKQTHVEYDNTSSSDDDRLIIEI